MSRGRKPYSIEVVRSTNKELTTPLLFDRDRQVFFAAIGMERVEHTDIKEARKLAQQLIDRSPQYVWDPIICVQQSDAEYDEDHHHWRVEIGDAIRIDLDLVYWRCERSRHPSKPDVWFVRTHTLDFEEKLRASLSQMMAPQRTGWEEKERGKRARNELLATANEHATRILPYSEELWTALGKIRETIAETRRRLSALIASEQFVDRLRQLAAADMPLMLPASTTPTSRPRRRASSG